MPDHHLAVKKSNSIRMVCRSEIRQSDTVVSIWEALLKCQGMSLERYKRCHRVKGDVLFCLVWHASNIEDIPSFHMCSLFCVLQWNLVLPKMHVSNFDWWTLCKCTLYNLLARYTSDSHKFADTLSEMQLIISSL